MQSIPRIVQEVVLVKKYVLLLLALAMILGLAACGGTQQADVVENVDPEDNSVVIETPPAIVSGPDTPTENYPTVSALPTTVPTADPNPVVSIAPAASPTTGEGDGKPNMDDYANITPAPNPWNTNAEEDDGDGFEYADDTGLSYNPTATDDEKRNAWIGYTNVDWANFRVGPGTEYKIYESLPKGSQVKVLGYTNGWAKVWYNDYLVGYIASNFISSKAPDSTASVIITPSTPAPSITPVPTVIVITP